MVLSELLLDVGEAEEEINIDLFSAGVASIGVIALLVGLVLLVATIYFATRGATPIAILCGFALLTLFLGPVLGLIIAIIILIVLAIQANMPMIGYVFGGWLLGTAIMVVTSVAMGVVGVLTL